MSIKLSFCACVFILLSNISYAVDIVTFAEGPSTKQEPPPYFSGNPIRDNAYIYISATVNNPQNKSCVSPASDTFFTKKQLDVTITAQVYGIFGVDSNKEIPIATYSWSSKDGAYCQSPWKAPVVLVPPSPIGVKQGINTSLTAAGNPGIVVRLRSSSQNSEKITSYASSLLGIAAGGATGGAATTVVGLTNLASGTAAKYLSDEMNKLLKDSIQEYQRVDIPLSEIAAGLSSKQLNLVQADVYRSEVSTAPADIRSGKIAATSILSLNFDIFVRRTMFDDDNNLTSESYLPRATSLLQKNAILNFPRSANGGFLQGFPTVFQRVNSDAPSFSQKIANADSTACDPLLVTVRDLGFNKIDRALVIGAVLDDAYPKWKVDPAFYGACLRSEPEIKALLEAIYPTQAFAGAPVVLQSPEVSTNLPYPWWNGNIADFMNEVRLTLFSNQNERSSNVQGLFGSALFSVDDSLDTGSLPLDPSIPISAEQRLSSAAIKDVGCIVGFMGTSLNKGYAGLIFTATNKSGKIIPYFLIVDFASPTASTLSVKTVWVRDLGKNANSDYVATLRSVNFGKDSICSNFDAKNKPRPFDKVLADITN